MNEKEKRVEFSKKKDKQNALIISSIDLMISSGNCSL
jgi:hypothetical protein